MAQIPNTRDVYVGDGMEDTFQVTFQYQRQDEVFVTVDGLDAAFTFISGGWVQLSAAPAYGAEVIVFRSTGAFSTRHTFENGVPLLPRYIDENNKQFLYLAQEAVETSDRAEQVAVDAAELVQTVVEDAAAAVLTSAGAVQVANDALASAQDANDKADAAARVANGIAGTAQGALDAAAAATRVANEAKGTADLALGLVAEAGVQTFNGRAGVVVPESGDYTAEQITRGAGTVESALRDVEDAVAQKLANLGTAAFRNAQVSPTDITAGALMAVGAGGWLGAAGANSYIAGYPRSSGDNRSQAYRRDDPDDGVPAYSASIHFAAADTWGRLRVGYYAPRAWIQGGYSIGGSGWTSQVILSADLLQTAGSSTDFPMSQAAVTNAINGSSIGIGQTWQDVTASRYINTIYTNTTGRPIMVSVRSSVDDGYSQLTVSGIVLAASGSSSSSSGGPTGNLHTVCAIVPNGATYSYAGSAVSTWAELR